MHRARRSRVVRATLALLAIVGWLAFAPTTVGGSTVYVITHGISMEPRFHTGDLALVRPAGTYRVGDIVAYHSSLLHTVVLHRIVGRLGERYVFKGDNNSFLDPTHPDRGEMLGKLWLRIPHGGVVLAWLHSPVIAAVLSGGAALLLLLGTRRWRRRRRDRRPPSAALARPRTARPRAYPSVIRDSNAPQILKVCAAIAGAFLLLAVFAFTRPTTRTTTAKTPYTESVSFGYHAQAQAGPVYPDGIVSTGDPVFLRLVHRVRVSVGYSFAAAAAHRVTGNLGVDLELTGPTGWSRTFQLAPPQRFTGDHIARQVTLDLDQLQSLITRVGTLTGVPSGSDYTLAVVPRLHLSGSLAGQPLTSEFAPQLSFQLNALQLLPGSGSTVTGSQQDGLTPSRGASVTTLTTASNRLTIHGYGLPVAAARWIALVGLLLALTGLVLTRVSQQHLATDPTARIQRRYGHLIVPITGITHTSFRAPIDVTSIDALAQLAERSERLILHQQRDETSTYLVDDEGTLYRYETRPMSEHQAPTSAAPTAVNL